MQISLLTGLQFKTVSDPLFFLTYDDNGNLLNDGTQGYTWDAKNRLQYTWGGASGTSAYYYDAIGRRLHSLKNNVNTATLYDGQNPVAEYSGTSTALFLTGQRIDEILARIDAGGVQSYLSDALGSTIALTDATGAMTTQYSYDPYGNTTQSGAASTNPYQYTARENDGTGLYYYRARYYHPGMQRFISEDPIGFAGGINQYGYADSNPLSFTDPLGLTAAGAAIGGRVGSVLGGMAGEAIDPAGGGIPGAAAGGMAGRIIGDAISNAMAGNGSSSSTAKTKDDCYAAYLSQIQACKLTTRTAKAREACYARAANLLGECNAGCKK